MDFGDDDSFSIKDSQTIFLLKEKSEEAVIDALKAGRVYALHLYKENAPTLVLDNFTIENIAGKRWHTWVMNCERAKTLT